MLLLWARVDSSSEILVCKDKCCIGRKSVLCMKDSQLFVHNTRLHCYPLNNVQCLLINILIYLCTARNYQSIPTYAVHNLALAVYLEVGIQQHRGFPGGTNGKESACSVGDAGLIPGLGRSPGEGNSNPLQYSCLENPVDRGVWWVTVHGVIKSQT